MSISQGRDLEVVCGSLAEQIVGGYESNVLQTPFGLRRCIYADFTASGRAMQPIEEYVKSEVLPLYGNVHSKSSATARQSSYFREEAREIIRNYLHGTHEDAVIFTGNGATGAAASFLGILQRQHWKVLEEELTETRWHTFLCRPCNLQLDGEAAAKAHLNSEEHRRRAAVPATQRTVSVRVVVFLIDPTLHHSSFLPFKELEDYYDCKSQSWIHFRYEYLRTEDTILDLGDLQRKLNALGKASEDKKDVCQTYVYCILNGCSNVTGCKLAVSPTNRLVHETARNWSSFLAFTVWDLASALGHTDIRLNAGPLEHVDVAFLSPHKLLGGPGTAGVLCVKKRFLSGDRPGTVGGGVVRFVSKETQLYSLHREEREEAGTPNIVACIRTGMVFKLASLVPLPLTVARESEFAHMLLNAWQREKRIQILGPVILPRFPGNVSVESASRTLKTIEEHYHGTRKSVISLMIKYGNDLERQRLDARVVESVDNEEHAGEIVSYGNMQSSGGLYLHHNFVCAVLNDVFGIQARPGCACAGPLSHEVLGMNVNSGSNAGSNGSLVDEYLRCLESSGLEIFRPGFTRISVHYSMTIDEIETIVHAVSWVAKFGWKLLPYYTFKPDTGEWTQNVVKPDKYRKWLSNVQISNKGVAWDDGKVDIPVETKGKRKDPKKLVGAVAMPGMTEAMTAMKEVLARRRAAAEKREEASKTGGEGEGSGGEGSGGEGTGCEGTGCEGTGCEGTGGEGTTCNQAAANREAANQATGAEQKATAAQKPVKEAKPKSVAEIRKMLEQQTAGSGKAPSVKALASAFEKKTPPGRAKTFTDGFMAKASEGPTPVKRRGSAKMGEEEDLVPRPALKSTLPRTESRAGEPRAVESSRDSLSSLKQSTSSKDLASLSVGNSVLSKVGALSLSKGSKTVSRDSAGSSKGSKGSSAKLGSKLSRGDSIQSKDSSLKDLSFKGSSCKAGSSYYEDTKSVESKSVESKSVESKDKGENVPEERSGVGSRHGSFSARSGGKRRGSKNSLGSFEEKSAEHVRCKTVAAKDETTNAKDEKAGVKGEEEDQENVMLESDEIRLAIERTEMQEAPRELQEYYDRAHDLITALESGRACSLFSKNRQGHSPPLPAEYAHLLWFALPGDAIYSMGLCGGDLPNEGEPAVASKPSDLGYPIWTGEKPATRPVHSPFEAKRFPARIISAGEGLSATSHSADASKPLEPSELLNWMKSIRHPSAMPKETGDESDMVMEVSPSVGHGSELVSNGSIISDAIRRDGDVPEEEEDCSSSRSDLDAGAAGPTPGVVVFPRSLRRKVGEAVRQFDMIAAGDRILVGLSGGKDSLTMLHLLMDMQKRSPVKFELAAATVDPQTLEYDPSPLVPYLASLGVEYHLLSYPIMDLAKLKMEGDSLCAFCARMKRGILYSCMRQHKYNKLALGQHLDDIAESFLMSAFYNGSLNTMKANYQTIVKEYEDYPQSGQGECKIQIIRPLVFVRERDLASFAADHQLPVIADNCPACFKAPKERLRMKHMLAAQEFEHPATMSNIKKAVLPLLAVSHTDKTKKVFIETLMPQDECGGMCSRQNANN
ncbi:PP-loop protein [Gregarina niphandrodes]|uniref:PP-loop protein n=1 Tax=Gregarina niphandrodes TaxID=110365 RepID=A0A023BD51_GRENI|nr:PP-loop protein [Gregarina niphandrodes]EZG87452.1 PP-loop protein [Gregarina niphandrodes]|eukprot:XP_011128657.1 PP-loop protein [Gregarina niphandrodes]